MSASVSSRPPAGSPVSLALTDRPYLRPSEVVALTGLSKTVVLSALQAGTLHGHRVGRAWVIPRKSVDAWLGGDTAGAKAGAS